MMILFGYLLSLTPDALDHFQRTSRGFLDPGAGGILDCEVDNYFLKFDKQPAEVGKQLTETVSIALKVPPPEDDLNRPRNSTHTAMQMLPRRLGTHSRNTAKYTWYLPPLADNYQLTIETPSSSNLRKRPQNFHFHLLYNKVAPIRVMIMLEVREGYRHFFAVNTESGGDQRLVPPPRRDSWDPKQMVADEIFPGHPRIVPRYLAQLRTYLVSRNAHKSVGIFREMGTPWDVQTLQTRMQQGQNWDCNDVHAISTCIKQFLRESPPLNVIPPHQITRAHVESPEVSWSVLMDAVPDHQSESWHRILWMLDLMALVVLHFESNRMGIRSIATAFAPNVFVCTDPVEIMRTVLHLVPFIGNLVKFEMAALGLEIKDLAALGSSSGSLNQLHSATPSGVLSPTASNGLPLSVSATAQLWKMAERTGHHE
eukprot:jgi/Hompol1/3064/HPOL_000031-RA